MAENVTGAELVPRGVEGTGRATILGNEPVIQNLARLSNRMDNLYRLKLLAGAKKEKVEKPEYDKTMPTVPPPAQGLFGDVSDEITTSAFQNLLTGWENKDPYQRQKEVTNATMNSQRINNFVTKNEDNIPKIEERLLSLSYMPSQATRQDAKNAFMTSINNVVEEEAKKNGVTDKTQKDLMKTALLAKSNFGDFYSSYIKENPQNINLNNFGERLDKSFGNTTRYVQAPDGTSLELNSKNIWNIDPDTNAKELNANLAKLAIDADKEDSDMFNRSVKTFVKSAAESTGDQNAMAASKKLAENNFDMTKLSPDELKLYTDKVLPIAEDAVLQRMFAGKGNVTIRRDLQTTQEKAKAAKVGESKAGDKVYLNKPYTLNGSYVLVKPGPTGEEDVIGANKTPLYANALPVTYRNTSTKTLSKDNSFRFNTGSKFWLTGHVPKEISSIFGLRNEDGSYSLEQPFNTRSVTLIQEPVYATDKNVPVKLGNSNGYKPKGMIVNSNAVGAKAIGDNNIVVVDVDDYLKEFMTDDDRKILLKQNDKIKGMKLFVSLDGNNQVMAELEGVEGDVEMGKTNAINKYMKNKK